MKLTPLLCAFLILAGSGFGQTKKHDPCDPQVTFCWYGPYDDGSDEVTAWGEKWAPQDSSEKPMQVHIAIRCVKRMSACFLSDTHKMFGDKLITHIDVLPVTSWSAQQITADMEDRFEPCEKDSYIINKLDRTVLMIVSPGPQADSQGCIGVMGKPKTVVYKLQQ